MDLESRKALAEYSRAKDESLPDRHQAVPWYVVNRKTRNQRAECHPPPAFQNSLQGPYAESLKLPKLDKSKYVRPLSRSRIYSGSTSKPRQLA